MAVTTTIEIIVFALGILALMTIILFAVSRGGRTATLAAPMLFALRIIIGIILTILGIIGSLLPILQGWMFFLLAALAFFPRSRFAVAALEKIEPRMPRVAQLLRRLGIGAVPARDTIRLR